MLDLSVVVPVYNMAKDGNLDYCMNSLVRQTLQSMEIVAVDDASTDDSLKILQEFEKRYPGRVRVVASPENRKQGGARNLGLREAQGRYIGFMDADDWVVEDLYERMVEVAKCTGADVVGTDMCRVYEHTMIPTQREECNLPSQTGIFDHEKRKEYLLHPGPLVTKIYAREIFFDKEFRFPEQISYEDNATFLEIGMRMKHFEHISEANVFYYQHGDSTVHTFSETRCNDRLEAGRIMMKEAKRLGFLEEFQKEIEYKFTLLFYINTLFTYMPCVRPVKVSYVKAMTEEMLQTWPAFRENPYYMERTAAEEKKLIDMACDSALKFVIYYKLLWGYRKLRKKLRK